MAKVEFSKDEEQKKLKENKKWELYSGGLVQTLHKAKELGWKEQKVQVRFDKNDGLYYVEPFEDGCGCRGLLKYSDYFD
jgi:hypothetical protein